MDNAGLETGGGEGALDDAMIAAGTFNDDNAVAEFVAGEGLLHLGDSGVEVGPQEEPAGCI